MRVLFQGASETWSGRKTDDFYDLGTGYAKMAADMLKTEYPDTEFEFINRGIGGDRAQELAARWDKDAIELQPDVISVIVGINDTWHTVNKGRPHEEFEKYYRIILERTRKETNAKIIMLEQFVIPHPAAEHYHPDTDIKLQMTRKLAREFADAFVPLDGLIAKACVGADISEFTNDGVHPKEPLARIIAKHYIEAFKELKLI